MQVRMKGRSLNNRGGIEVSPIYEQVDDREPVREMIAEMSVLFVRDSSQKQEVMDH